MRIPIPRLAWTVATVHGVLALLHVYWATGATWPAADERALSYAVLGGEASFAPVVLLPLTLFHMVAAVAVIGRARFPRKHRAGALAHLAMMGIMAGLAVRTTVGLVWALGIGTDLDTPFYWLNLFLYTPVCLILTLSYLTILRHEASGRA